MEMLDFADFDRKFELKISEASGDIIAKKEQGGSVWAQLSDDCKEYLKRGGQKTHVHQDLGYEPGLDDNFFGTLPV